MGMNGCLCLCPSSSGLDLALSSQAAGKRPANLCSPASLDEVTVDQPSGSHAVGWDGAFYLAGHIWRMVAVGVVPFDRSGDRRVAGGNRHSGCPCCLGE